MDKSSEIMVDPGILSGTPVFKGTRVPLQNFLDSLKAGETIDSFLEGYPSVSRNQLLRVFEQIEDLIVEAV